MKIAEPNQTVRLWLLYRKDGKPVSGLTDVAVAVLDGSGSAVLAKTAMSAGSVGGEYVYDWNTGDLALGRQLLAYYYRGDSVIEVEEMAADVVEDSDGQIL